MLQADGKKYNDQDSVGFNVSSANFDFASETFGMGERIFLPIDTAKDCELMSWYTTILPMIERSVCNKDDASISLTLLRIGDISGSVPAILIRTTEPRSKNEQNLFRHYLATVSPSSMQLPISIFLTGQLDRIATQSDVDARPCLPKNSAFYPMPPIGASIGMSGTFDSAATLGGYIYVDDSPYMLTVHHLFADELTGAASKVGTGITQPSLQEIKEDVWKELMSCMDSNWSSARYDVVCMIVRLEIWSCLPASATGRHKMG